MTGVWTPDEATLVNALVRGIGREWDVRGVGREVRSHGRCRTDLAVDVVLPDGSRHLVGVEAKVHDWPRAVLQAVLNRRCFDASYVAVPDGRVRDGLMDEALARGLGVLAVSKDGSVAVVVAARVCAPDEPLRDRVGGQLARRRRRRPMGRTPTLLRDPTVAAPVDLIGAA